MSIRYGKNLTSLEQDENCANCYTGVYPYWTDMDGNLIQLPEKIVNASGTYSYVKILSLDFSQEWQEAPTEDQLRARAEKYMKDNNIGTPVVSWKVEFVQLEQAEEYKGMALLERVLLGDTVSVEFPQMGISASARVVAVEYDPILERYNNVTLGSVRANIADTIVSQQKQIDNLPGLSEYQKAAAVLTATLLGAKGGAVRLLDDNGDSVPDTLYIADNPDPAQAVKVWRFNYEGWGASRNGYNGPFVLGATLENGFLADFITAGTLDAALITVKNLVAEVVKSVAGNSTLNITGAILELLTSGKTTVKISNRADGLPIMYMYDLENGQRVDGMELTPHHFKLGGTSVDPTFEMRVGDGVCKLGLNAEDIPKTLAWKDNGDGTFALIGT